MPLSVFATLLFIAFFTVAVAVTSAKAAPPVTLICGDQGIRTTFIMDFERSIITKAEFSTEQYSYGNWSAPKLLFENVPFTATDMTIAWHWEIPGGNDYYSLDRNTLRMEKHLVKDGQYYNFENEQCHLMRRQL